MPTFTRGSTVYLKAEVVDRHSTDLDDATLDGTVEFSIDDGETWDAGEWVGDAYMKRDDTVKASRPHRIARRTALLTIDDDTATPIPVQVRVTDSPEVYVIKRLTATVI